MSPAAGSLLSGGVELAVIAAVFLLAGLVKGVAGLGLPTVAIGLLSLIMPPAEAAAILVLPSLVTNLWQTAFGPGLWPLARRLWPMLVAVLAGAAAGAALFGGTGTRAATAALGAVLVAYAALGLSPLRLPQVPPGAERWAGPLAGGLTGLVTAATGVFVIPGVPYMQALGLDRDRLVQAMGLYFTVATLALAGALAQTGALGAGAGARSVLGLGAALVGMRAGQAIRSAVRPETFRRCFFACLLLLGGHLLLRALV